MNNKDVWWPWAFKNIAVVLIWTALAIVFNKWWIVLFSLLFVDSLETETIKKYFRTCNGCGKHSPYTNSYNDAIDEAEKVGWVRFVNDNDKWEDYCPNCQKNLKGFKL